MKKLSEHIPSLDLRKAADADAQGLRLPRVTLPEGEDADLFPHAERRFNRFRSCDSSIWLG